MRSFTYSDAKSNKFWEIDLQGRQFTVRFGKTGAAGQTQVKEFADEAAARREHDKLVAEKLKKGYVETTPAGAAPAAAAVAPPPPAKAPAPPPPVPAPPPAVKAVQTPPPPPVAPPAPVAPAAPAGGRRTFEYSDASAHKFWNIELTGAGFTVTYGRIGSAGQTQVKTFADEAKARKEHDKLVAEKVGKGYRETTPSATKKPLSLRESLEQALVENPADLASHMAYADYLTDEGDPRGEFIRVQLALEDPSRSPAERKRLQEQEKALLDAHLRDWAGELAPYLLGENKGDSQYEWRAIDVKHSFARGWLHTLDVNNFDVEFTRTLTRAPQSRLLRRLVLREPAYQEPGEYEAGDDIPEDAEENPQLYPLIRSPYLTNVREFVLGELTTEGDNPDDEGFNCHTSAAGAVGVIKQMPRLEELYLLAHNLDADQLFSLKTLHHLRVLLVYHTLNYPLGRLAKNPSLASLTHLLCHPHAMEDEPSLREQHVKAVVRSPELKALTHLRLRLCDAGDAGVREIIGSGILKRLKMLDLRHGCITDEGARLLAACPDLTRLERLDLSNNALTDAGIQALQATGVSLLAGNQWRPSGDEWSDQEYLYVGDIE